MSAPISSVNKIVGNNNRTSTRDLIGEVADSLQNAGVKLMLYYHTGQDSHLNYNTTDWWQKQNFPTTQFVNTGTGDRSLFLTNWINVITEIGNRYGTKLDGWFFDDGAVYYPAPFEKLGAAARAGNPNRIVSYNPFWGASITDFQDVYFGEYNSKGEITYGSTAVGGNGIFTAGPHAGQLQHGMFTLENDWGVCQQNQPITTLITETQLGSWLLGASSRNVPLSLNMMMWEDGTVQTSSLNMLRNIKTTLIKSQNPANGMLNDSDPSVTYTGTWGVSSNRNVGDFQNDVHYSSTNGDYFVYSFTGSGVDYITEKNSDMGDVDVFIDGIFKQTVSCYNTTRLTQQNVFSIKGLSAGKHVLKAVKKNGQYMLVDAVTAIPSKVFYPDFKVNQSTPSVGSTVTLSDLSYAAPDAKIKNWYWIFEGGSPSTSTEQNPTVVFNSPGVKNIQLRVDTGSTNTLSFHKALTVYPYPIIDRKGWTIKSFDSQATGYEAAKSIDSTTTTFWHTKYGTSADPVLPHEVVYDMGKVATVTGFGYLPRTDGNMNGVVTHYSIFVSDDITNWGPAVYIGSLASDNSLKMVNFQSSKSGRYLRFYIDQAASTPSNTYASCAEFYAYGTYGKSTSISTVVNDPFIDIYPIPANNLLTISSPNDAVKSYRIIDLNGRLLMEYNFMTGLYKNSIDISGLNKGVYFIQMTTSAEITLIKRFMKE